MIAAAHREGCKPPLVVTRDVLKSMKSRSVVCDLNKGNVEGSQRDTTLRIEGIVVTNTTCFAMKDP